MARKERVEHALLKEISTIIHDELKDPRLGFVTIIRVELTPDLRYAKVFYSVLGKEQDSQKTKAALESAHGFIKKLIAERINLRYAIDLTFEEDQSSEYSVRIQEILQEIHKEDEQRKSNSSDTEK